MWLKNIGNLMKNSGVIFILSIVGVLFYLMCYYTPLAYDDYAYSFSLFSGKRITSFNDILKSLSIHYLEVNGRIVSHFITYIFLWFNKNIFNLMTTIIFLLYGLFIYNCSLGSLKCVDKFKLVVIYIIILFMTPNFGENYLWITGACNYLYMSVLFLAYLSFLIKKIEKKDNKIEVLLILIFGGIIVGNSHECISSISFCLLILLFFFYRKNNLPLFICSGIGLFVGSAFLLFSSGQVGRISKSGGTDYVKICENAVKITFEIVDLYFPLLILLSFLMIYLFKVYYLSDNKDLFKCINMFIKDNPLIVIYFISFLFSVYSLSIVPYFPDDRVWHFHFTILILIICLLYKRIDEYGLVKLKSLWLKKIIICCSIFSAVICVKYLFKFETVYSSWKQREYSILLQKESGVYNISIPSLGKSDKFHVFSKRGEEISTNSNYWVNKTMARYYGVESIVMVPINDYR